MKREGRLEAFQEGVRTSASLLFGVVPWAMVAGAAMVSAGLTPAQAIAMSLIAYAGSIQLAVLPLLLAQAPLWVMLATGLVINLRYVIYSASIAPHFNRLPLRWRMLLSYIATDGMFALFMARYGSGVQAPDKHWYYLGGSLLMWSIWQVGTCIGVFAGALIPKAWSVEFAATLGLIGLLVPLLFDFAVVCGALAAALVSLSASRLPLNLGLILAVAVGVAVGVAVAALLPRKAAG